MLTYHNGIFPMELYVGKCGEDSCQKLADSFKILSKDWNSIEVDERIFQKLTDGNSATTIKVVRKEDKRFGILVYIDENEDSYGIIAHECSHIADIICDRSGVKHSCFEEGETHAHLVEWAFNCITNEEYYTEKW